MTSLARARDAHDMYGAVRRLPDQIETTWAAHAGLRLPWPRASIDAVAIAGMGGSAIGGDLAAGLFGDGLTVPAVVVREPSLPTWIGPRTLFIAASFSGNTLETNAAWEAAGRRGALRVAIGAGGRLAAAAARDGAPFIPLPEGGAPRAALGYGLTSVLAIWHACGLLPDPGSALADGVRAMRALVSAERQDDADVGPLGPDGFAVRVHGRAPSAAVLATRLDGRLPLIYVAERWAAIARRWKAQLNENAKVTAAYDTLPELHHNSVVGFAGPAGLADHVHVVFLERADEPAAEVEATCMLLDDHAIPFSRVVAPPGAAAAQGLWLIQMGDLASVHLAARRGIDPTPIAAIDRLKAVLAGHGIDGHSTDGGHGDGGPST